MPVLCIQQTHNQQGPVPQQSCKVPLILVWPANKLQVLYFYDNYHCTNRTFNIDNSLKGALIAFFSSNYLFLCAIDLFLSRIAGNKPIINILVSISLQNGASFLYL